MANLSSKTGVGGGWYYNFGGSRRGVIGGHWGFLIGEMEDRVIPDIMNDVFLP